MSLNQKVDILKRINLLKKQLRHNHGSKCEVYARIVGYYRPVHCWNKGKQSEYQGRKTYKIT